MSMSLSVMKRGLVVFMALCILSGDGFASSTTGKIVGTLVDSETGDALIGANVFLQDTMIGAASDLDGAYEVKNIPPGTYNLVISIIGYAKKVVQNVQVSADDVVKFDIALEPEAIAAEDVIVTATMIRNTEASLLKDRQKSLAVSDAISAEAISKSGSGNAAEAMTKVTGASVVDGKYVYIRGLGDRYSSTTLNGTELPSADPEKRAVQMDMFPSNLLENIVTTKSFTPDKPGSFSGGSVDVGTRAYPEVFSMKFSSSTAYNSRASLKSDFLSYPGSGTDWLGMDDGLRELPKELRDRDVQIPTLTTARRNADLAAQLDAATKAFSPVMAPSSDKSPINQSYAFSIGNQTSLFGKRLGYLASLSYKRGYSFYDDGTSGRYELGTLVAETDELNPNLLLRDIKGSNEVVWGGLGTLSYKFHNNHEIGLNAFISQSGESSARYLYGSWPGQFSGNTVFETRVLKYSERNLQSYQASGEHYFPSLLKTRIEWKGALTSNSQDEPDTRYFSNHKIPRDDTINYAISPSNYSQPARYFRNLQEDGQNLSLDISIPFRQWARQNSRLKFGGAYSNKERTFEEQRFQYIRPPSFRYSGDPIAFFGVENTGVIGFDSTRNEYIFGNVIERSPDPRGGDYSGDSQIYGSYFMVELPLTSNIKMIGGARFEATRMEVAGADSTKPDSLRFGRLHDDDLLPSLNLIYALRDNMNLRVAYGRTLARPTLREKAPYVNFEFANDYSFAGNVNLKRTLIDNFDLRWEWFSRPGEIYAISGFYKIFHDPIERSIVSGSSADNPEITFANVDRGTVAGLEFEFRKGLDQLSERLANFSISTNLSFVHSSVDIPDDKLAQIRFVDPDGLEFKSDSRPLQGQSPYLMNIDIGYDNYERGTAMNLSYNLFGDRLSEVTSDATPDVYERARGTLNFNFSQKIYSGLGFKFSAKNILDSPVEFSYQYKNVDFIRGRYERGRTISMGFRYEM